MLAVSLQALSSSTKSIVPANWLFSAELTQIWSSLVQQTRQECANSSTKVGLWTTQPTKVDALQEELVNPPPWMFATF